ncbi:hypothetical protein D9758_002495 [Tetrapyrgos nigripes]|uniref:Uncharacterized protein n=1 Tax=Tetrapyrgos nigripes TaxID=182062 RepID=A0A8H5LTX4_9AGAR|nr:hypothetical protein D9758_002495 [Tetrapyrgos nigripes]
MSTWRNRNHQARTSSSDSRGRGSWRGRGRGSATVSANRRMENIASVSRSSGLQEDGDALKNFKTQEEYRVFIADKLTEFWKRYPQAGSGTPSQQQIEVQENILILFRKLREGIVSSKRQDQFALEGKDKPGNLSIYETSLHLATLFHSPKQINSIIPHLVPDLYSQVAESRTQRRLASVLISLLHQLVQEFPSQGSYYTFLRSIPESLLPRKSEAYLWLDAIASTLRVHNHYKFERLTSPTSFSSFLADGLDSAPLENRVAALSISSQSENDLLIKAFHSVIDDLRGKARESAWTVIRSAYREISCHTDSPTREWLAQSLALRMVLSDNHSMTVDQWLQDKFSENHVRPKEGVEGRWIISKAPR